MPTGTTIQQFVKDLRERKSTIARAFDACSGNETRRQNIKDAVKNWDLKPNLPDPPEDFPDSVGDELGLSEADRAHINEWPKQDKIKVRDAIVTSIENTRDIEFFWDLNDDLDATESVSDIVDPGTPGKITVTFLTPRSNVSKSFPTIAGITIGGINVEV